MKDQNAHPGSDQENPYSVPDPVLPAEQKQGPRENSAAKEWLENRLPIARDLVITHLNSITVEQFDDTKNRGVIKNDLQIRLNSLFPNKSSWEDTVPIRRILFLEFYRQ